MAPFSYKLSIRANSERAFDSQVMPVVLSLQCCGFEVVQEVDPFVRNFLLQHTDSQGFLQQVG